MAKPVRKSSASFVEQCDASPSRQLVQPTRLVGRIPTVLDMGNESWNDDDILGTLPEGLVGDVYIAAFGVPNFRRHPPELLRRGSIPGLWLTRWQGSSRGALLSGVPGRCPFG